MILVIVMTVIDEFESNSYFDWLLIVTVLNSALFLQCGQIDLDN